MDGPIVCARFFDLFAFPKKASPHHCGLPWAIRCSGGQSVVFTRTSQPVQKVIEHSKRSCALACDGATESVDIRILGHDQGTQSNSHAEPLTGFKAKTLLGESFLGQRLLCRHGRVGCRDDSQVRKISRGKERESEHSSTNRLLKNSQNRRNLCLLVALSSHNLLTLVLEAFY